MEVNSHQRNPEVRSTPPKALLTHRMHCRGAQAMLEGGCHTVHKIIEIFGKYTDSRRYQSDDVRVFMEQCRVLDIAGACASLINRPTPFSNTVTVVWLGDGPSCHVDVLEWRNQAMDRLYTLIQRRAARMTAPVVAARPTIRSQSTSDCCN